MYKNLATQFKAPLVPFMLEGVADKPTLFQSDRLHPNAQAHPIILANIWPQIAPLVKAR
jgi:acyl-CoA thioesterase-1